MNLVNAVEQKICSLASIPPPACGPSPVLLFTISKNLSSGLLARLVHQFQNLTSVEPIGVLAQDATAERFSVSIATWAGLPNELVTFTSTIASRPPISLGREIKPPCKPNLAASSIPPDDPLNFSQPKNYEGGAHQTDESPDSVQLPIELTAIQPSVVKSLIFFSAPSPQLFLKTLARSFPSANLMGLVGSSTVFETGRRSTLFRGKSITGEEGAVGIAVLDRANVSPSSPLIRYPGMEALGPPMQATRSKGNIILMLNSQTASGCLLEMINKSNQARQLSKTSDSAQLDKKQYYLGFLNNENQITEINRITGGSISRGAISLDRERKIPDDCSVQLIHFPENTNILANPKQSKPFQSHNNKVLIEFECNQSSMDRQISPESREKLHDSVESIHGLFSAGSEFGFIPRHQQIVDIDHAKAILELS